MLRSSPRGDGYKLIEKQSCGTKHHCILLAAYRTRAEGLLLYGLFEEYTCCENVITTTLRNGDVLRPTIKVP
ncbi:unnamed protein product [Schistocephalus solidus]|uniref:Uncharacterized protein n=1 Tax=Schistocephalus solidus TaxID=70667 RepID=A0A183T816_SCHSO|nr:unnamed protein product [Schistocephalus solidus]